MSREIKLSSDIMIVSQTDEKGVILYANDDFCKIAGYTKDELIGKPHNIVRHSDMPKVAFQGLWETIRKGEIWNGIVKNKTSNGDYYWVNATAFPVRKNNQLTYISVRVKATDDEINFADNLYKELRMN